MLFGWFYSEKEVKSIENKMRDNFIKKLSILEINLREGINAGAIDKSVDNKISKEVERLKGAILKDAIGK